MLRNILKLERVKELKIEEQRKVNGGVIRDLCPSPDGSCADGAGSYYSNFGQLVAACMADVNAPYQCINGVWT